MPSSMRIVAPLCFFCSTQKQVEQLALLFEELMLFSHQ